MEKSWKLIKLLKWLKLIIVTENVKTCIHDQLFKRFMSFKMNVYLKKFYTLSSSALFYQVEIAICE